MKNLHILAFVIASLLLSPAILAKEDVDTSLSTTELFIYSGETANVDLTITNIQDKYDVFSTSILPSYINKITAFPETASTNFGLGSKMSTTVKLSFSVLPEAEETDLPALFRVFVTSLSNANISSNKTIQINVLRSSPVYMSDFRLSKSLFNPGETVQINSILTNTRTTPSDKYRLQISVKKDDSLVKDFDETISEIPGKTSQTVSESYTFDTYAPPGIYTVSAKLKDNLNTQVSSRSVDIRVNEINKTTSETSDKFKILSVDKTRTVKNVGNVPTSVALKDSIPSFAKDWVVAEITPSSVTSEGSFVVYEWLVALLPGQEATIEYQINLAGVWAGLFLIVIIVYVAFKFVFTPSITKIVKRHGVLRKGSEIIVTLEVKNNSLGEIKDLVVTDIVPQLTEVVQRFDTLKPVIRKTSEGAELSWKFDSLKVAEERIINYRIKPTVDIIGSLELPSAKMGYYDGKRVRRFTVSRAVSAKER